MNVSFSGMLDEVFEALALGIEQRSKLKRELEETIQIATVASLAKDLPDDKKEALALEGKDENAEKRANLVAETVGKLFSENAIRQARDKTRDRLVAGFIDSMLSAATPEQRARVQQLIEKYLREVSLESGK